MHCIGHGIIMMVVKGIDVCPEIHPESEEIMAAKKANGSGSIRKRADGRWEGLYSNRSEERR